MGMNDKLYSIDSKNKIVKFLNFLSLTLASVLSLVGVISIMYLIMFLYELFELSFIGCVIINIILTQTYSFIANFLIKNIDNIIKYKLLRNNDLCEEKQKENKLFEQNVVGNVKTSFESLSVEKQFKGDEILTQMDIQMSDLNDENIQLLQNYFENVVMQSEEVKEVDSIEYVLSEISSWCYDSPGQVMLVVLEDIRKDRELLKYYLPEVDWTKVDLNEVYDRLFNWQENLKQAVGFSRKKVISSEITGISSIDN